MGVQARNSTASATGSTEIQRLLVVRLSAMGDVLHALPAVAALRRASPNATIGWVIEERWSELLCSPWTTRCGPRSEGRPLVDAVHTVNTRGWRRALLSPKTWSALHAGVRELRDAKYDTVLDFQGAVRSAALARLSAADIVYGFAQPRENASSMFYTRQVQASGTHVVEQNFSLARAAAKRDLPFFGGEVPRDSEAENSIAKKLKAAGADSYAILNPGAGWGAKQWPADRYGEVARNLALQTGLPSLVNFGPGEEELARVAERASGGMAKALATTVSELIALTRGTSLFIGGDTGPMHLAALLRIPVVAIFGPTSPARNGPFGTRSIVLRHESSVTSHSRRTNPEEGMLEIGVDEVVSAAVRLLGERNG